MFSALRLLIPLILLSSVLTAHAIDGSWVTEREVQQANQTLKMSQTFNLKASGKKLTGTIVIVINGDQRPPLEIKDGKIDGKKFSFNTLVESKMGNLVSMYEGVVDGQMIKGVTSRGGPKVPFEAKRR